MNRAWTITGAVAALLLLTSCALECTQADCTSTLEIELSHSLALEDGPYLLEVTTPEQSLRCSIGPEPSGDRSCFGFRFADLGWDESRVTLLLTGPFGEGAVFESVDVALSREGAAIFEATVPVTPGPANQPNGPGCEPTCFAATASATL